MDEITEALEEKQVERVKGEVSEVSEVSMPESTDLPKTKTKKVRSQKQIETFEKARKK